MPARTRKDQKMNLRVKKRHRTPPYESEKVAKKSEKVVKKSDTKPYATILSIFIEVLALFLPHACTRASHGGLNLGLDSGRRPNTC